MKTPARQLSQPKQGKQGNIEEKELNYALLNSPLNISIIMELKLTSNKYIGK